MAIGELKGLVESRARSAGDIERLEQRRARIDEEIAAARKRLESADTLISRIQSAHRPVLIESVRGRRQRSGKVKAVIDAVLLAATPKSLPTPEIAFVVAERIQIRFSHRSGVSQLAYNCVNRELYRE